MRLGNLDIYGIICQVPAPFVSIIIPAYNEARRLPKTLQAITQYLNSKKYTAEIIVVDDGSTDRTAELLKSYKNVKLLSYHSNRGKGYAVNCGVKAASGTYILFTDADNATSITQFHALLAAAKRDCDVVIGSRFMPESKIIRHQPWYRVFIGRAANCIIRLFLISGIKDTQCGFKLFSKRAAQKIFARQKIFGWGFDMELLIIAKTLGYRICEVPVEWSDSHESRLRPLLALCQTFSELVRIKWNVWRGEYGKKF